MPSDYEAIRRDHERLYGEAVGEYGGILAELYAERTHFVFELLQNAQDAGAARIVFELQPDRLEVRHDGRLFTERDVRSICAIKRSTKMDLDVEQIGRFGIGFKSVYAYTHHPAIHSGDEHFVITDYVHPHAVGEIEESGWWTTLQIFPFDRDEVTAEQAVAQIGTCLAELSPRTILFLRNVREISWSVAASASGTILREEVDDGDARRVRLLHGNLVADAEEWLVFEQPVELVSGRPPNRVEIAFLCQTTEAGSRIVVAEKTELVAFFPTSRETHLGFLVQGPFVPTPARDNVREDNAVNERLVDELATLTVGALPSIRDRGLLDVACLECLPIDVEAFPEGTLLRPLYDAVREALLDQPLVPTADGGHAPGIAVRIARGIGLRELISPEQLGALIGAEGRVAWATADISVDRTPVLRRYFTGYQFLRDFRPVQAPGFAPVMELDPDAVVRRLEPTFLAEQSDEWMVELYTWLGGQRAQFRELPRRQILRREDGEHVSARDDQDRPQVWLPAPTGQSSYPTIRRSIAEQPAVIDFLHQVGLTEPDVVDEVLTSIVPRYEVDEPDDTHYAADLERIALAVGTATPNKRTTLRAVLENTAFLVGRNAANEEEVWSLPSDLYEPTETLTTFLAGNPNAWFLAEECVPYAECWREVGLRDEITINRRKPDNRGYVVTSSHHGRHRRGRDRFDPALKIEGLEWAVEHPNLERSLIIWSLLSELGVPLRGTVEQSTRQNYSNATIAENVSSPAGQLLAAHPWLLDNQGEWRRPDELAHDGLSEEFPEDEGLARRLGMRPTVGREIAAYLEIEPEDLELLRRNPEILREALSAVRESGGDGSNDDERESEEQDAAIDLDVDEAIREAFNKPGRVDLDEHLGDGRASDPERRQERAADAVREAQADEPKQDERWRMARRKEWEPRNPDVREYLLQTYGGRCQICKADPFPLRDGTPYFEAKYLISPTAARWVDDPGNALSLCPTCLAKVLYGSVEGPDVVEQLDDLASRPSDFPDGGTINFELCGEPVQLTLRQRHLIDLAALLDAGREPKD